MSFQSFFIRGKTEKRGGLDGSLQTAPKKNNETHRMEITVKNCKNNRELFGKELCKLLGWKLIPKSTICYYEHKFDNEPSASCVDFLSLYLDSISEADSCH